VRVLVTRPQPQADEWVARLAALGIDAVALPLLGIADGPDPQAVRQAWAALPAFGLAMFVSPSAVERFFAHRPGGQDWPRGTLAAGTGPGTAAALRTEAVPAPCVVCPAEGSARFDSEALWELLRGLRDWRGQRVLIVRGVGGRDWLADTLGGQGAAVEFVAAYRRLAPTLDSSGRQHLSEALARPHRHRWLFSSSEAVRHLPALAPRADWSSGHALATHPRIAQAAREIGFGSVETVSPTAEAVASAVRASIQSARS